MIENEDARRAGSTAFRQRWLFTIVCRSCLAQFEMEQPDVGLDCQPGFWRLVVLRVPEVCRQCKSLRVVGETAPASPSSEGPTSA